MHWLGPLFLFLSNLIHAVGPLVSGYVPDLFHLKFCTGIPRCRGYDLLRTSYKGLNLQEISSILVMKKKAMKLKHSPLRIVTAVVKK